MTAALALDDTIGRTDDYLPGAVGHLVLAEGADGRGRHALALWPLSPSGRPTGARLAPYEDALADRSTRMRLDRLVRRRAVITWTPDWAEAVLGKISDAPTTFLDLPAAAAEIPGVPAAPGLRELAEAAAIPRPELGSEAAAEALHLTRLAAWAAARWHEAETERVRSRPVRGRWLGPETVLPPAWTETLRRAATAPTDPASASAASI